MKNNVIIHHGPMEYIEKGIDFRTGSLVVSIDEEHAIITMKRARIIRIDTFSKVK